MEQTEGLKAKYD